MKEISTRLAMAKLGSVAEKKFVVNTESIDTTLFSVYEIRYTINATKLRRLRKRLALKQSSFAGACGWSRAYQAKLENGSVVSVTEATAAVISAVVADFKV